MSATIRILILLPLIFAKLYAEGDSTQRVDCQLVEQEAFMPATDGYGKTVFIKQEFIYQCSVTETDQTRCLEWEVTKDETEATDIEYTEQYETLDHSDSLGGAMIMVQNLNRLDKLFTGWKGVCYDGIEADFSWTKDPYMWASMAVSTVGQSMNEGLYTDRILDGDFWGHLAMDMNIMDPQKIACLANSGIDLAKTADNYFNGGEIPCDPKDEICEDNDSGGAESDVYTLNASEFEEFKIQLEQVLDEPGAGDKYTKIIDVQGTGSGAIYTITYQVPPSDSGDYSSADMDKAMQKIKDIQAGIGVAVGTAKAAGCLYGKGGYGGGGAGAYDGNSPIGSVAGGVNQAIGIFVPPIPYGIALQLMTNVLTSFSSIHTCTRESDAKDKGTLHEKTQRSLKWGMCHKTAERCEFTFPHQSGCKGKRYFYCCYDQPFTKFLMIQVKAQLGKTWDSCADMSLNELKALNFRQCSPEEMDFTKNGGYIDGAMYQAINTMSFQYKHNCVDLGEFREYMQSYIGEVDDRVFFDQLEDFRSGFQE